MSVTKEEITTEYGTKGKNKKELHFKPRWKTGFIRMLHLKYRIEHEHLFL